MFLLCNCGPNETCLNCVRPNVYPYDSEPDKCECGSVKAGGNDKKGPNHSHWCPLWTKWENNNENTN